MDKTKKQKILSALWSFFQTYILEVLKDVIIKKAIKLFLKTGAGTGFRAWLVTFVATELYEEVGRPVAQAVLVEVGYAMDIVDGRVKLKRLKEATSGEDYDSSVDDILS